MYTSTTNVFPNIITGCRGRSHVDYRAKFSRKKKKMRSAPRPPHTTHSTFSLSDSYARAKVRPSLSIESLVRALPHRLTAVRDKGGNRFGAYILTHALSHRGACLLLGSQFRAGPAGLIVHLATTRPLDRKYQALGRTTTQGTDKGKTSLEVDGLVQGIAVRVCSIEHVFTGRLLSAACTAVLPILRNCGWRVEGTKV